MKLSLEKSVLCASHFLLQERTLESEKRGFAIPVEIKAKTF